MTNATIKSIEQGSGRDVQFYSWKSELALFRKFLSKSLRNDEHLDLEAENVEAAKEQVNQACNKLLCNQIMESFTFSLEKA